MSNTIQPLYSSALNNYDYANKSFLASSLDILSYPTRKILGGKNVCVSGGYDFPAWSATSKIITIMCLAYFYKIALFTIVCLTLKTVYFHLWEKSSVHDEIQQTFQDKASFNQFIQQNKHEDAFLLCQRRPAIAWAPDIRNNYSNTTGALYRQYLQTIQTTHITWTQIITSTEVQRFMQTLPTQETHWLINQAVLQGLNNLEKQGIVHKVTRSKEYFNALTIFIQTSLQRNYDDMIACYQMLEDKTFKSLDMDSETMQSCKSDLKIKCATMHYAFSRYDTNKLKKRGFITHESLNKR